MMSLVEARCLGGSVNIDSFFYAIFEYCQDIITYFDSFVPT